MSDSGRPSARCREEGVAVARPVVDEQAEPLVKGEAGTAERGAGVARTVQACRLGAKVDRIGQPLQPRGAQAGRPEEGRGRTECVSTVHTRREAVSEKNK